MVDEIDHGDGVAILVGDEGLAARGGAPAAAGECQNQEESGEGSQWAAPKRALSASSAGCQRAETAFLAASSFKLAGGLLFM